MSAFEFVVLSLACWRFTYVFTDDIGPGDIFLNLRTWSQEHSRILSGLLTCFYCASIWTSGILALAAGGIWIDWLALSGSAILIEVTRRRIEV